MRILRTDDIDKGDFITIIRGQMVETPYVNQYGEPNVFERQDRTFNGWIFKVRGINLPFIAVEPMCNICGVKPQISIMSLDTRLYEFGKVEEEYVKILCNANQGQVTAFSSNKIEYLN